MRGNYVYCAMLLGNAFLLTGLLLNGCGLNIGGEAITFPPDEDAEAGAETGDIDSGPDTIEVGDAIADSEAATDSSADSEAATDSGVDSGPVISDAGAPNVTFDLLAMACFKAMVIEDGSKKVVWGSGNSATCPTDLADIYLPPSGYTLFIWVKDPTNNLLSFNSSLSLTAKARCSVYATAPTWAQVESDYSTKSFGNISNGAVPPAYFYLQSCVSDAEFEIHP